MSGRASWDSGPRAGADRGRRRLVARCGVWREPERFALTRALQGLAIMAVIAAAAMLAHLALIEVGREVVTLRTQRADGSWHSSRFWAVDDAGSVWLHSAGDDWLPRFANPEVELERRGETRRYRATPMPGPHPRIHELLRAKYGIADWWVRVIGPDDEAVCVVRLDAVGGRGSGE